MNQLTSFPCAGSPRNHPLTCWSRSIPLIFLLGLFSGSSATAQLTQELCNRAIEIKHLQTVSGDFEGAENRIESYAGEPGYTGREVVYKIVLPTAVWYSGALFIDFTGDAKKMIFLKDCSSDNPSRPFVDPGTGWRYPPGLSSGIYYVVIEGPADGSGGNFEFTLRRDDLGSCDDGTVNHVTIGQPTDPEDIKFTALSYDYVHNYCGNPDPAVSLESLEAVYKLAAWPGGDFKATLSEMKYGNAARGPKEDAALILLTDCETPNSCVGSPVVNNGASELVMEHQNLPPGDYFVVVDGKTGGDYNSAFTFKLTVDPPPAAATTVTDGDKNEYPVVTIPVEGGTQTWIAKNLHTTSCIDETPLTPFKQQDSRSLTTLSSKPGYIWYNDDPTHPNSQKYGPVYNWEAVSSATCKICPEGYRIPTFNDWQLLLRSWYGKPDGKGGIVKPNEPYGGAGLAFAAKQLRAQDDAWYDAETNTNSSGFSALPGGWLWNGSFRFLRDRSAWWGIASSSGYQLRFAKIARGNQGAWGGNASKIDVLYVRCIKDE